MFREHRLQQLQALLNFWNTANGSDPIIPQPPPFPFNNGTSHSVYFPFGMQVFLTVFSYLNILLFIIVRAFILVLNYALVSKLLLCLKFFFIFSFRSPFLLLYTLALNQILQSVTQCFTRFYRVSVFWSCTTMV